MGLSPFEITNIVPLSKYSLNVKIQSVFKLIPRLIPRVDTPSKTVIEGER